MSRSKDVQVVGLCNVAPHKGQGIVRKVDLSRRGAASLIEGVSGPRHAEGRLFGCANSATTHAILTDGWGYAPVARFERTRQVMSKGREGGEKGRQRGWREEGWERGEVTGSRTRVGERERIQEGIERSGLGRRGQGRGEGEAEVEE